MNINRHIKTILLLISIFITLQSHARNSGSDRGLRIRYKFYFKEDSTIRGHYMDSTMCLDIFGDKTAFYSEKAYRLDSTVSIAPVPISVAVNPPAEFKGTTERSKYFIDFKKGTYIKYDASLVTHLKGYGTLETPQWRLLDITDTICGYPCRIAEASYLGRTWRIWYTTDIPVSAGPWLLWGAPGLILRARESRNLFVFMAFEAGQLSYDRSRSIQRLADAEYHLRTYRSMKKMEEILTRVKRSYEEDMIFNGYGSGPGYVTGPDGSIIKETPLHFKYIPLISEEYWDK